MGNAHILLTMQHKSYTYRSRFGEHCSYCGSLVEACGDVVQCRIDANLEIDEAILKGTSDHPWLETAHRMLGEFLFFGPEGL